MIGYPGIYLKTGQDSPGSWGCENGWVVREESDKGEEMGSRTRGLEGRRGRSVVGSLLQRKEPAPHGVAHQFGVVLEAEFPHQVARWFSTVRWLIWSRAAISPPVFPSAASWRTSRSRAVNVSWGSIWAARDCSI